MFGQNINNDQFAYSNNECYYIPSSSSPTQPTSHAPPLIIPSTAENFVDPLFAIRSSDPINNNNSIGYSYTSSGCSSYGGSPPSITSCMGSTYEPCNNSYNNNSSSVFQRSISSHSLIYPNNSDMYPLSPRGCFEGEASSFRKVLSTGDLQGARNGVTYQNQRSNSPLSNERSIIESMSRASPYSPEEKKERIERYRSKRNLRNFNKKIKYECRKTLADSRPRIRGRFARNDEIIEDQKTLMIQNNQIMWDQMACTVDEEDEGEEEEDDENWVNLLHVFTANTTMP